jgi:hypothetical protein
MNNNTNTFRAGNETLFLINILNTMYNDNLRQINNLTETLNNLNNSNNQIRNLLIHLLNNTQGNRNNRRSQSRRFETNFNNIEYNLLTSGFDRDALYIISDYTTSRNLDRNNNRNNNRNNRYHTLDNRTLDNRTLDNRTFDNGTLDSYAFNIIENLFQPVEIYPTQSQIETATRRVRYSDIARPLNTSCPISMDEFNDNDLVTVIRHCGHTFHTQHIMNWFRNNCRCPVCRYDIREYNSNVTNQFFNNTQDSSNNNVERNNNVEHSLGGLNLNSMNIGSLEGLLNNQNLDPSGNPNTYPTSLLASLLFNALNRNQNTR